MSSNTNWVICGGSVPLWLSNMLTWCEWQLRIPLTLAQSIFDIFFLMGRRYETEAGSPLQQRNTKMTRSSKLNPKICLERRCMFLTERH